MFSQNIDEPAKPGSMPDAKTVTPGAQIDIGVEDRHATLMQCLKDESELQAEERIQMSIDGDYQDHLHWRPEDAEVLMERGQAPLVFNQGRQSVEWMSGMQKRMRTDYDIMPRSEEDQAAAEAKTKVFKYVSDVNLAPWHVSFAYRQAVIGGLGWLEEGINTDPGCEQIFTGSEDWRNVFRDSRNRHFDINEDSRYLFRKKRVDVDYAIALMPHAKAHLIQYGSTDVTDWIRGDDVWYMGERLTGASDVTNSIGYLPSRFRDRSAYIGGSDRNDTGRRLSLDLLECWYRVPEAIKVFGAGPLKGKEFDPRDPGHAQLKTDRWRMYGAVAKRMRVMIATQDQPLWDGKSPFRHGKFHLIPVWGSRRGRDGQPYGLWRGMRDLNDDINKRASKALHAASSNRVIVRKGAVDNVEEARAEAARPDMFLEVKNLADIKFEKPLGDMQANLELLSLDREILRESGGVTNDNLGQDSNVISGKAVGLKQDQGGLVTSEFPDNLLLALQVAGKIRLSNIEQFMTEPQVLRITGEAAPIEWISINEPQADGSVLNPIANSEADFIMASQDYRESFAQAALEEMIELLGKIGTFSPEIVTTVLDLVVDSSEIRNKDEWVSRIRKLNGQRDPKKPPTPEEIQAQKDKDAEAQKLNQINMDTMQATLDKLKSEISGLDAKSILTRVESMFSALQAAQITAVTPVVAPTADVIMQGAGFVDQAGADPNLPVPEMPPMPPQEMQEPQPMVPGDMPVEPDALPQGGLTPDPIGLEGVQGGIETPTGADNAPSPVGAL